MNNVTRQLCGALGVAVIGGIYASGYRSSLNAHAPGLGLTGQALTTARESVGSALKLAADIGGRPGAEITAAAKQAFIHGLHFGVGLAAVMCLAGAVLAFGFLPARASEPDSAGYRPAELGVDPNELDGVLAVE